MTARGPGPADAKERHLVLVGAMGAGKTTTGRALAAALGWPLRDCDADLEARTGATGAQLAARSGVDALHELEEEVLLAALRGAGPAVIASAGWVVESERCRAALRALATVVWLDAPIDALVARMASGDHRRPVARPDLDATLARRRVWLEEVADLRLDAREPTGSLTERIVAHVHDPSSGSTPVGCPV